MSVDRLRIRCDSTASSLTVHRQSMIHECRISWFKKLGAFHRMQSVYMLGIVALIEGEEATWDSEISASAAEDVKLWLPSEVPEEEHLFVCKDALFDAEFCLQERQCSDALASLRSRLMARQHLI